MRVQDGLWLCAGGLGSRSVAPMLGPGPNIYMGFLMGAHTPEMKQPFSGGSPHDFSAAQPWGSQGEGKRCWDAEI